MNSSTKHIHLIGIGGAGISAIARVLLVRGFVVSGSDQQTNKLMAALEADGARVFVGHAAENIAGADEVVRSSAVPDSNPEVIAAREAGVPVLKRHEFLGTMMAGSRGIAVAGTHGKTTTTGMIAHILLETGQDPSVIVGGTLPATGTNGLAGHGRHFVIEADEYDRMFLGLRPTVAVITNLGHDHVDIYPTAADYVSAFEQFVALLDGPAQSHLIVCLDDPGIITLLSQLDKPSSMLITGYGLVGKAHSNHPKVDHMLFASDLKVNDLGGLSAPIAQDGATLGMLELAVPGEHNLLNSLAALAVGLIEGLSFEAVITAMTTFTGMGRRFEIKGEQNGVAIIDDYAHHPNEIAATLAAGRQRFPHGKIWAVWQPHTFSRLKNSYVGFQHCFKAADEVIVLDVYRSRETDTLGLSAAAFAQEIVHPSVRHIPERQAATSFLLKQVSPGDAVIVMNAGDATAMTDWLVEGYLSKEVV
ncbi:MAG: UDP-N-acetylmuramate--alanine ligase [Cellvibrionaceae bacterium]|jgi:UDP-N-acetylmuramate--alanine ligase